MRFAQAMSSRTDEELIEIVTDPSADWEPDAIEAAKLEIEKRGLQDAVAPRSEEKKALRRAAKKKKRAQKGGAALDGRMKALAVVMGIALSIIGVFISLAIMLSWKKKGEGQKGTELVTWTIVGAAVMFVLAMIVKGSR